MVYSTEPFKRTFYRDLVTASEDEGEDEAQFCLSLVEMLYTCNILAIVGRGAGDMWRQNVCILWDDRQARSIVEMRFASPILNVSMLKEVLLVVLEQKLCIYLLKGLFLIDSVVTAANPSGLCVAATTAPATQQEDKRTLVVACPAVQKGTVQVLFYLVPADGLPGAPSDAGKSDSECTLMRSVSISAHENDLSCLCLSDNGSLLATASAKGTLVRLFSTASGQLCKEVRRGVNPAQITCLCISPCNSLLAVCSNTGTLHLYRLGDEEAAAATAPSTSSGAADGAPTFTTTRIISCCSATRETSASATKYSLASNVAAVNAAGDSLPSSKCRSGNSDSSSSSAVTGGTNVRSSWPFLSKISPYFQSEWSMAQFRFHFSENFAAVCAFAQEPQTLIALTSDGCFYKLKYDDRHGGPLVRTVFLRLTSEDGN